MPDYGGLSDIISLYMSSSITTNILVLQDPNPDPASIWYIDEGNNKTLLKELGEINMGNYTSLRDFISFSKATYPAERYMIVLWDHGMAWDGACIEITNVPNGSDHLTMDEMKRALSESGGVDIIGFSACTMGCIESVYELRECTNVYVGSEEMNGFNGWPWNDISTILTVYCDESTYDISKRIMSAFEEKFPYYGNTNDWIEAFLAVYYYHLVFYPPALTMSAIRTDTIDELVSSIDELSRAFIESYDSLERGIDLARFISEDFPRPMVSFKPKISTGDQIDIFDFVDLLSRCRQITPEISRIIDDVKANVHACMLGEHHQIGHRKAHGLSLYFPYRDSIYTYNPLYSHCDLDFTEDTNWDEFIEHYHASHSK
jgi:hypothetical protein